MSSATQTRFGRFALRSRIARGTNAEIYLAEARETGNIPEPFALKLMLPHLADDDAHVQMFLHEARLVVSLAHHPNLVRGFEYGEVDGRHYLAMEYLRGRDAGALARRAWDTPTGLSPDAAMQIVAAAAGGLDHAHNHQREGQRLDIVHRDVNPKNILLTFQGAVKVLDFGVAYSADHAGEQKGTVKGMTAYCSPEQLSGGPVDARSDVFSLGVVLHEMLTGQRLFRRATDAETMLAVVDTSIPSVSETRPDLPDHLDEVVACALARDPARRYRSARALADDLLELMSPAGEPLGRLLLRLFPELC